MNAFPLEHFNTSLFDMSLVSHRLTPVNHGFAEKLEFLDIVYLRFDSISSELDIDKRIKPNLINNARIIAESDRDRMIWTR